MAPNVSEMAMAPKTTRENCDMAVDPSPHGDQEPNASRTPRFSIQQSLNRV
jgi:hypothetical protein